MSILHVWINHDNDLVDLTITSTQPATKGHPAQQVSETIHTNKKHPFLTTEDGFVKVADLFVGMHVVKADGSLGMITAWKVVPGSSVMYNLEVAQDHTFTVGDGLWVVHNCGGDLFTNKMPGSLQEELNAAKANGVKPLSVGDSGFDGAINEGTVKWAVSGEGDLKFVPKFANGNEISHAVIHGGAPVLAAGEADIAGSRGEYMLLDISNHSGHYEPGMESLEIGIQSFAEAGIR